MILLPLPPSENSTSMYHCTWSVADWNKLSLDIALNRMFPLNPPQQNSVSPTEDEELEEEGGETSYKVYFMRK